MKRVIFAFCLSAMPAFAQQGDPAAHFVQNWDLDADGRVTVEEARERRGYVFLSFDANEDGFIDAQEYTLFDEARAHDMATLTGKQHGAMRHAADGMTMDSTDADDDGRVSRAEFVETAAGWIDSIDTDGDGVVTMQDFGPRAGRKS